MPFSGTLKIIPGYGNNRTLTKLLTSSPESVARPSGGDIQVDALQNPRNDEVPGPHDLMIALQTDQISQFTDHLPDHADTSDFINKTDNARYVIIPNGEFLFANKIIGYNDEFARFGIHLFVNSIEWLLQDNELIEIRNRALPQMIQLPDKDVQRRMIWLNVFGVPGLVILCMIVLRIYRMRRRKKIEKEYSSKS